MARSGKSRKKPGGNDDVPPVFQEMLAENAAPLTVRTDDAGRTVKRRRVGGRIVTKVAEPDAEDAYQSHGHTTDDSQMRDLFDETHLKNPQTAETDSEDSAGSDMDWEEVDLRNHDADEQDPEPQGSKIDKLNLVLGPSDEQSMQTTRNTKRKPITLGERKMRLDIHKMHVCSLLAHVFIRNYWCEDDTVQNNLRGNLSKKTISYLNPGEDKSQFQRSRSFMDGLEQASESFRNNFKIVARGMCRPVWAESPETLARSQPPTDIDLPMQKADFRSAAQDMMASRDIGAQLFCALLRSVGVDARLICSLQVLPLNASMLPPPRPQTTYAAYYPAERQGRSATSEADSDSATDAENDFKSEAAIGSMGGRSRFDAAGGHALKDQAAKAQLQPKGRIRESKYPVYWVEAFNEASQKWVPVDPLVSKTIAKPSKFEPPAGDRQNNLTYVIAFEDDGSARDVTMRYAKAYNAKTRRERVDSTKEGDRWWKRVMKTYRRRYQLDRDQLDNAELAKKEAAEPMPRNVQDFKDHPYYALERHLRRHEAIHPKREVGKVGAGKSGGAAISESIYRRRDVHIVQSGDKWYRSTGRQIKPGEQPLKRVPARRKRKLSTEPDEQGEENAGTALYAIHQTMLYKAPPVVDGRITKNAYGNLDIYVPSMIPAGGLHIEHPETVHAAKMLGIDFAEAVTGFVFKGRHGTAVTKGAVIASENREAVGEIISALEDERLQAEQERRSHEAMRVWKRFLAGLRIRERIEGYDVEGERDAVLEARNEMDEVERANEDEGGGFFPDQDVKDTAEPTAGRAFEQQAEVDHGKYGGFMDDDVEHEEHYQERRVTDPFLNSLDDDGGGGFLVEDDHDEGAEQKLQDSTVSGAISHDPSLSQLQTPAQSSQCDVEPLRQDAIHNDFDEEPVNEQSSADEVRPHLAHRILHLPNELTQEELDEARLLQEYYEEEQKQKHDSPPSGKGIRSSAPQISQSSNFHMEDAIASDSGAFPDLEKADHSLRNSPPVQAVSQLGSPVSDKGSLLSEDPEDEDAEPDWLI